MATIKLLNKTLPGNTDFITKNNFTTKTKIAPKLLLAHTWNKASMNPTDYWMSEKLDGVRSLWNTKEFMSRLGNTFYAPKFFLDQMPKDLWLDGELWEGRKLFSSTVSTVKTISPVAENWKKIVYKVFDVPSLDLPFEERVAFLKDYFQEYKEKMPNVQLIEFERCGGVEHLEKRLAEIESVGGEGIMLRQPNSRYVPSRSKSLLKVKSFMDAEARVIRYEPGQGKYTKQVGGLWCKTAEGKVFCVGSGMSDEDRKNPPPIGSLITYRYQEVTDSGAPRFPSFVGVRIDAEFPENSKKEPQESENNYNTA